MSDDEAKRHLAVGIRIQKHGRISLGFLPGITLDDLEAFADRMDREHPENAWNPVTGPWDRAAR